MYPFVDIVKAYNYFGAAAAAAASSTCAHGVHHQLQPRLVGLHLSALIANVPFTFNFNKHLTCVYVITKSLNTKYIWVSRSDIEGID